MVLRKNSTDNIIREAVREYLGNRCDSCGVTKEQLQIHHIIPSKMGGTNTLGNLQLLCQPCHLKIHHQFRKIFPTKPIELECLNCGKIIERIIKSKNPLCQRCYQIKRLKINAIKGKKLKGSK